MRDWYSIEPEDKILNSFVELSSNYSEDEICFALTQLFQKKFLLIQPNNLSLSKEKKVLCTPLVPDGFN